MGYPKDGFRPELVIVVPAYKEAFADIELMIRSLCNQSTNGIHYALCILVNVHKTDKDEVKQASQKLVADLEAGTNRYKRNCFSIYTYYHEFQEEKSGVGHARKLLMDMALKWFNSLNYNGLIVNLDADTTVSENYIHAIDMAMRGSTKEAASIEFEHRWPDVSHPIIDYELHLRYFINMQRWIGLPFAFQTVGSAMVVRAWAYAKEGGMTKKQAGEDFYFMHKYAKTMNIEDISSAIVYPSARISDRVPFGTGRAIMLRTGKSEAYCSYNPQSFRLLKLWLKKNLKAIIEDRDILPQKVAQNGLINTFMSDLFKSNWGGHLGKDPFTRYKNFFGTFNAFSLMKLLHFLRDNGLMDMPISQCLKAVHADLDLGAYESHIEYLKALRERDRRFTFDPLQVYKNLI